MESARAGGEARLVVFSGGTAFNDAARELRLRWPRVSYVLPVSDDGGSTSEITRVLGGPAVGDVRARCMRLAAEETVEERCVKALLSHRLSAQNEAAAKQEWFAIAEGTDALWEGISTPYKQIIRRFLNHFFMCVLREEQGRERVFRFRNGSVGNFFFAGARLFFASIESAIFLYVSRVPALLLSRRPVSLLAAF
jgi:hypothetical protein